MSMEKNSEDQTCEAALEKMLEALGNHEFDRTDLDLLCAQRPECTPMIRESYFLWYEMDALEVPEPSEQLRGRFLEMLAEFEKEETPAIQPSPKSINWTTTFKWAAIFIVGLGMGLLWKSNGSGNPAESYPGHGMVSLLTVENPTTDRLSAIQSIKEIQNPEDPIIEALYQTLLRDPNDNVRLSAIEAMIHFIDHPKARESLVSALPYQSSPIVQLTLAELLVNLQTDQSLDQLKKLLESDRLDHDVKLHLKETINTL